MSNDNTNTQDPRTILEHLTEKPAPDDTNDAPSLKTIIREQVTEDELPLSKNRTLRKILGGDILNTGIIRRQVWLIMLISLFIVVYISNRYKCQQDLILINSLNEQLKDAKYRALSSNSDLTQQTRESKVLEQLRNDKDSTLHIATQPPYIINVPKTDDK